MSSPEAIADAVLTGGRWMQPSGGQTVRDALVETAREAISTAERAIREELEAEVRDALEGDSNDAEHDALAGVAERLGITYRSPFDDEEDTASSASSQHYIKTGRYLTRAEVEELAR